MDCQYGHHYFLKKQGKNKQVRLQDTKKIGCQAKIKIKSFTLYPEYSLPKQSLSSRQQKQLQEEVLEQLRQDLASGKAVQTERKYFVSLPTEEAHSGHPTGHCSGFSQRIHPLLIEQITELVSAGITNTGEVKRLLRHYTRNTLAKHLGIQVTPNNRALFPTDIDVRNHVATAKKALEFSKLDQENLRLKVDSWEKASPDTKFFFRPYIKSSSKGDSAMQTHEKKAGSTNYRGNTADHEGLHIVGSDEGCEQTMLYVHQEKWQQELLQKYGKTIAMIDATYKTTRYDLALFFICVRTNVGYMVVAEFITQSETAEHILEALLILKSWNQDWQPKFFMSDYSEVEHDALEQAFPGIKVFLCDFHREQCWERWVRDTKHGLTKEEGQQLLGYLRECAVAEPGSPEDVPLEFHYERAVKALKESAVWKKHLSVRQWLNTMWLCISQVSNCLWLYVCRKL